MICFTRRRVQRFLLLSIFFSVFDGPRFFHVDASSQPTFRGNEHSFAFSHIFGHSAPFSIPPWLLLRRPSSSQHPIWKAGGGARALGTSITKSAIKRRTVTMGWFGWDSQSKYERNQRWKKPRRPLAARLTSWIVEKILHKVTDQVENLRVRVDAESSLALLRGEIQVQDCPSACKFYSLAHTKHGAKKTVQAAMPA
jgi:hypothetical protein